MDESDSCVFVSFTSVSWFNFPPFEGTHRSPKLMTPLCIRATATDPDGNNAHSPIAHTLLLAGPVLRFAEPGLVGRPRNTIRYTLAFHFYNLLTGLIMLWGACKTPCGSGYFSVYASMKLFRHPSTQQGASGYDH